MTLLKDNNYKEINVALLSLEADIKNKITGFDTSVIDKQLAEINSRIDKINDGSNNTSDEIEDINYKLNRNSNKIKNIERNIEDIDTKIDGIEQKLSDIFSAENKVTDFNTTKDSGIYYWLDDAANKPGTDYGVLLVNKYDRRDNNSIWINQIAYGTNNKIYFRQNINSGNWTEWKAVAYLDDLEKTTTKSVSLSTVTTNTTKYIKLGTFHWYDSFSFRCRITGNSFEDKVDVNILSSNSSYASVCGYYSTNSMLTKSIIVKRGAWNSDFEIYLKIVQFTTVDVYVTIDKGVQDRINISESTTAPSGTLEEIVFSNLNGMFTSNIDAKNISGKVSTADTADAIIDYNKGTPIKVRWGGPGINSADWYPAFNADGSAIEPISKANIRAGKSDRTTGIEYTGESDDCISAQQTPESFNNSLSGEWASYIICNHGNGGTYYHQMLRFPFFSDAIQLQRRAGGVLQGWKNVAIVENENTWAGRQSFDTAKVSNKMVIPIGAPSSLEDGCIWIER